MTDPLRTAQWTQFKLTGNHSYHVNQNSQTQEVWTQLVVPHDHKKAILKLAHDISMAGHLGQEKNLA